MAIKPVVANFVVGQNSAIVLHAGKTTQKLVAGIQGMGLLLGFTMNTTVVAEMGRRIALVIPSGGQYEPSTSNYNYAPGDPTQDELALAAKNATLINDLRNYVKVGCDFTAADLISDSASGLYVGGFGDPAVDSPSGLYQGSTSFLPAGPWTLFVAHTGADGTELSYVAATRTLSTTGTSFVTLGFEIGDTCILDYADSMDPKYLKILTVTATDIVFTTADGDIADVGDFSGITTTRLHGATPQPVSATTDASC